MNGDDQDETGIADVLRCLHGLEQALDRPHG